MTKKSRRASERRNEQDEPTKGARPRTDLSGTGRTLGEDTKRKDQETQEHTARSRVEATGVDKTQEGGRVDFGNESSVRYATETQTGHVGADQEFRHAVLAADEVLPETAVGEEPDNEMNSFLNGELEVISGEDADQKYELKNYPSHLGRANTACHINLTDTAVSHTHLIFDYIEMTGRWTVCPSADAPDGALLNSVRIQEIKNLSHGDVIRIGRSELRFFYRSGAPQKQEIFSQDMADDEPTMSSLRSLTGRFFGSANEGTSSFPEAEQTSLGKQKKQRQTLGLVALAVLLCAVGGYVIWMKASTSNRLLNEAQVMALLEEAITNVEEKDIVGAATKIESLLPWVEEIPELKSFQRILISEQESQTHFAAARVKYSNGKIAEMESLLTKIPHSSIFADDRDALRADTQEKQAVIRIEKIETLIQKRNFTEAISEIKSYRTLWAENEKIESLMRKIENQKGKSPPDSERMRQSRGLLRQGSHLAALKVFDGQTMSALERGLQKELLRFKDALAMGRQALKSKSGSKALKAFSSVKMLYARISRSDEPTAFTRSLTQNLANAHFLLGASSYAKSHCKGASHFRQAYALVPDDLKTQQRLERMRLEADQIYREAKAASKLNPKVAHEKAAAALCLVPKDSALYRSLKSL